jgi:ketosteroid isomerase-like protein
MAATEHPNAKLVRRLLAAFSRQDRDEIVAIIADDCVWRVPGDNALAGEYVGRPAILSFFGRLRRMFTGPATFEIIDIATSDERAVAFQYGIVVVGDRTIRLKECLVYRVRAGQVVEVDEFQADQRTFDEVFSPAAAEIAQPAGAQ